jgi:hypothetical protein
MCKSALNRLVQSGGGRDVMLFDVTSSDIVTVAEGPIGEVKRVH